MNPMLFVAPDTLRAWFCQAMSAMYKTEVPQYSQLAQLVTEVNQSCLQRDAALAERLRLTDEHDGLDAERHGAVRLGKPQELSTMRRLFAIMGMQPVGYYDLSEAGVPVHATAFRAADEASLHRHPFRVFTSLLRPELIADPQLREQAKALLEQRQIFTPRCLSLIEQCEQDGGLNVQDAQEFVRQALETFRWHREATVDADTYQHMRASHPLVADIVCFKGPHINHLTPRTLDIDAVQRAMGQQGIRAKTHIEGPPARRVPILLRQTSFLALAEDIVFTDGQAGSHTARFGEIEQRGCALTRKGRALYDKLLTQALGDSREGMPLADAMSRAFAAFPDDLLTLFGQGLAFVRFAADRAETQDMPADADVNSLLKDGWLRLLPMTYEDFLPVSAAGIFRSNLGDETRTAYGSSGRQAEFESALGARVMDEFALYGAAQSESLHAALQALNLADHDFA